MSIATDNQTLTQHKTNMRMFVLSINTTFKGIMIEYISLEMGDLGMFTMTSRKTSENTFIGRVVEFPEILIESLSIEELKEDLKGAIKHVVNKNILREIIKDDEDLGMYE